MQFSLKYHFECPKKNFFPDFSVFLRQNSRKNPIFDVILHTNYSFSMKITEFFQFFRHFFSLKGLISLHFTSQAPQKSKNITDNVKILRKKAPKKPKSYVKNAIFSIFCFFTAFLGVTIQQKNSQPEPGACEEERILHIRTC